MANPLWTSIISATAQKLSKTCPHCGKKATYPKKEMGQFYTCKHCHHRFKEHGSSTKKS
ncbi:MAG TPA: hypothetical protein VEF04_12900 [Blastocatellia bacterium]|nr:hypothetical protein [Blastocatellia bacterium]